MLHDWDELVDDFGFEIESDYDDPIYESNEALRNLLTNSNDDGHRNNYKLRVSQQVKRIGNHALSRCSALREVILPDSVTSIGNSAFINSNYLTHIDMPKVETIDKDAFALCENLIDVEAPQAKKLGACAFQYCSRLKTANFPEVTEIGTEVFFHNFAVTEINLPKVTVLPTKAFYECYNLTTLNIPNAVDIGDAFYRCYSLSTLSLSDDLARMFVGFTGEFFENGNFTLTYRGRTYTDKKTFFDDAKANGVETFNY